MILRRFIKHISSENWFAVGLDVIVVVVGIFLGMQVTEWNQGRHAANLEQQYLQALDIDIHASKDFLEQRLKRMELQITALNEILKIGSTGTDHLSDYQAAEYIHFGLNSAAILPVQLRTYEDLKGSNTVALLKSFKLRNKLRELDASVQLVRQEESERMQVLYRHVDPMLLQYSSYVELTQFWRNYDHDSALIQNLLGKHSAKEIYGDPALLNIAILLRGISRTELRFLNALKPLYDQILVEIANSHKRR
jgi:hypothetical protein